MEREKKYMSLQEAVQNQVEKFPTDYCFECETDQSSELVEKKVALDGITVWNFPVYRCVQCGSESHRASIAIAVEQLQSRYQLHGGYTIEELLTFKNNKNP